MGDVPQRKVNVPPYPCTRIRTRRSSPLGSRRTRPVAALNMVGNTGFETTEIGELPLACAEFASYWVWRRVSGWMVGMGLQSHIQQIRCVTSWRQQVGSALPFRGQTKEDLSLFFFASPTQTPPEPPSPLMHWYFLRNDK